MTAKIYLMVIDPPEPGTATILQFAQMPAFKGSDDENLACGACKTIVGRNVSTRTIFERLAAEGPIVVVCDCGAHNLLPTQRAREGGAS